MMYVSRERAYRFCKVLASTAVFTIGLVGCGSDGPGEAVDSGGSLRTDSSSAPVSVPGGQLDEEGVCLPLEALEEGLDVEPLTLAHIMSRGDRTTGWIELTSVNVVGQSESLSYLSTANARYFDSDRSSTAFPRGAEAVAVGTWAMSTIIETVDSGGQVRLGTMGQEMTGPDGISGVDSTTVMIAKPGGKRGDDAIMLGVCEAVRPLRAEANQLHTAAEGRAASPAEEDYLISVALGVSVDAELLGQIQEYVESESPNPSENGTARWEDLPVALRSVEDAPETVRSRLSFFASDVLLPSRWTRSDLLLCSKNRLGWNSCVSLNFGQGSEPLPLEGWYDANEPDIELVLLQSDGRLDGKQALIGELDAAGLQQGMRIEIVSDLSPNEALGDPGGVSVTIDRAG